MKRIDFLKKKIFFGVIPIFIILFALLFILMKIFILEKPVNNKIIAKNILSKEEATKIYKKEKQNRIAILADKYKYVLEKEVYYKLCNWFDNEE